MGVTERGEAVVDGDEHEVMIQQVVRPEAVAAPAHGVEPARVHEEDYRELARTASEDSLFRTAKMFFLLACRIYPNRYV